MEADQARRRFTSARIARLATVRPDGSPHVVPIAFVLRTGAAEADEIAFAIDHKPKSTQRLQRLANLLHEPRCSVLVDHADDDWERLWWVRADGTGAVIDDPPTNHPALAALIARHHQYRRRPPRGPLVVITVERWRGWSAT